MNQPETPQLTIRLNGARAKALLDLFAEIGATPASGADCLVDQLVRSARKGLLLTAENMIGYDRLTEDGAPDAFLANNSDIKVWVDEKPTWNEGCNGFHLATIVADGYGNIVAEDAKGSELARAPWDDEHPDGTDVIAKVARAVVINAAHDEAIEIDAMLRETNG